MEIDLEQSDVARVTAICLILLLVGLGVFVGYSALNRIYNSGGNVRIDGFNLYHDENLTMLVTFIDFGEINETETGSSDLFYLVNDGGKNISDVIFNYGNWNPSGLEALSNVYWNYTGGSILIGEVIRVYFTMEITDAQAYQGLFTFDIYLSVI